MAAIQHKSLFGIPIYRRVWEHHESEKPKILEYFSKKENFGPYSSADRLLFTSPNLHKDPLFHPFYSFAMDALRDAMDDLGFESNIAMTGMWGTVHPDGGYHHRHTHFNSFLAGVYYLDGSKNSSGTAFYNPLHYQNLIFPAKKRNENPRMVGEYIQPFEEGTLIIFPAWLAHSTAQNNLAVTNSFRKILSFNSMPVGATNNDIFDRYHYVDTVNYSMPHQINQIFGNENFNPNAVVDRSEYFKQLEQETKKEGQ